jgi:hypothetical protein
MTATHVDAGANANAVAADALYVYCVARGDGNCLLGPIGINGQTVYTLTGGPIRAVVHNCPSRPYESQDPQVLQQWIIAHQEVVQAAARAFGAVLPMSFDMIVRRATTGSAGDALRAWLDEKRDRFSRLLDRLDGKAEYGVQVFCDCRQMAASLVEGDQALRDMRDEAAAKPRGLAHVIQQKLARAVREGVEKQADTLAQDFYTRLRRCVVDVRVEKLRKDDSGMQMLLNLSCLMPDGAKELGRELDAIQETSGVSVRFTGPWPPYSFVGT